MQDVDRLPVRALAGVRVLHVLDDLGQLRHLLVGQACHVREHGEVPVADLVFSSFVRCDIILVVAEN